MENGISQENSGAVVDAKVCVEGCDTLVCAEAFALELQVRLSWTCPVTGTSYRARTWVIARGLGSPVRDDPEADASPEGQPVLGFR